MEFNNFKKGQQKQFNKMVKDQGNLFLTDISKDALWEHYLNSYPEGTNLLHKERLEYDCNSCRQFIRPFANIVSIVDNKLISIWDIPNLPHPYDVVAASMSELVKSAPIKNAFVTKVAKLGVDKNRQLLEDGKTLTWEHFYQELPRTYVNSSSDSIEAIQGDFRDTKNVFERSMEELTIEAGKMILELIDQGSLYRGQESKTNIISFLEYKEKYERATEEEKNNWCWSNSFNNPISRIRNTAIGTLLIDLSKDVDLVVAVKKFEKVMAPTNYKRPNAIFTKKMIEEAEKTIEEMGFTDSLGRRFASLEDISLQDQLFVNRDAKKRLKNSVFDALKEDVPEKVKNFDKVEEIGIEDFIKNILPRTTSIELMPENRHKGNLMSLVAPKDVESKTMFKWSNNFSWAYNGDITDSMKQNVKKAGGNVDGVLRFSIQWNDGDNNQNDFDAHCLEPNGNLIDYTNMRNSRTTGVLDVDITQPRNKIAVENITWTDKNKMLERKYEFWVHNYSHNGGRTGFSAEIEYDGQIHRYEYTKELRENEKVLVAEIDFDRVNGIKFVKSLDSSVSSKEIWGVKTNKFSKVAVMSLSPNHWGDQVTGNKHYFFFLEGCINENTPRGFFNEFLNEDLTSLRKVFEALGSKLRVENSDNQLSGLGFSSTQRNSVLAKIEGSFTRTIKIIF